tara:strand:+ start:2344 stop:3276 length:933 start_codon:yes stop_codon:yes gene_type:complete
MMAEAATPLLSVKDLTTRFHVTSGILNRPVARVHAVESVSFDLHAGETLSLVGESGCGKTTTGRTIMGLEAATSGQVYFKGNPTNNLDPEGRREFRSNVQMIFQDPYSSLNPRMTLAGTIGEPIKVHKLVPTQDIPSRIAELFKNVNLPPSFGTRYPHELSGGQRQRISIARALALNPQVIICDEAVSALDVTVKAQVINLLMDLQEEFGLAFLFISHDIAVVERVSHRVAVMYLGQIVEIGPRAAVFENPRHSYTRRLLSAVPIADPRQRRTERDTSNTEIPSAVKPLNYTPTLVEFEEVGPGHFVAKE